MIANASSATVKGTLKYSIIHTNKIKNTDEYTDSLNYFLACTLLNQEDPVSSIKP